MGKRSRSRSSSPQRSRKHKSSHSKEEGRRRSKSRDREKHRSRSRDRKMDRERRQADENSSERRSSRQNHSSDGRRHRRLRSRSTEKSHRRNSSDSAKTKSLPSAEEGKSKDKAPDIAGYAEMTPAERVRAKLKAMLDKATASAATSEETVVAAPPPSEAQIQEIDSDVFCSGSFSSSREKKQESHQQVQNKTVAASVPSFPRRCKEGVEDEYAPQVVELLESTNDVGSEQDVVISPTTASSVSVLETPVEEKKRKWLEKLQKMRQGLT